MASASAARPSCCLDGAERGTCIPAHKTVVLVGDSLIRYQYLDLAYSLKYHGTQHILRNRSNPLQEDTWIGGWPAFYNGTTSELQPEEIACDCHRRNSVSLARGRRPGHASKRPTYSQRAALESVCEFRMFHSDDCSVRLAYVQAFGSSTTIKGHLPLNASHPWQWEEGPRTNPKLGERLGRCVTVK